MPARRLRLGLLAYKIILWAGGRNSSVPASGDLSVSGGRDLTIKQGAQVQAAGALNASPAAS